MATVGETQFCPKCDHLALEYEWRLNTDEKRAECVFCGYFYERTNEWIMSKRFTWAAKEADAKIDLATFLKCLHFYQKGEEIYRLGYIEKEDKTDLRTHITDTWFQIPSRYSHRPKKINWVTLSEEELEEFDWFDWEGVTPEESCPYDPDYWKRWR